MQVFSWVFQSITRVASMLSVFVRCYHTLVTDNSDHLNGSDCQVPPLTLAGCALHFFQVKMIGFRFPNLHHLIGHSLLPNGASPLSCWSSVWQPNRMSFSPVFSSVWDCHIVSGDDLTLLLRKWKGGQTKKLATSQESIFWFWRNNNSNKNTLWDLPFKLCSS